MRIDLSTISDNALNTFDCDRLDFHLSGDDVTARTLYLWLAKYLSEIRLEVDGEVQNLPVSQVGFPGFSPEESLLPYPKNVFDGYRILQEYFIFPQRFHFFSLDRLRSAWPPKPAKQVRFELHFSRPMSADVRLRTGDISLYCTPAVNLFDHDAEPIHLNGRAVDQYLLPSGQRPDAYEVFSVDAADSYQREPNGQLANRLRTFHPFESLQHEIEHAQGRSALYFRTRLQQSWNDDGITHRVAFVRADETAYIGQGETVSLSLTCTNRDLPLGLATRERGRVELARGLRVANGPKEISDSGR